MDRVENKWSGKEAIGEKLEERVDRRLGEVITITTTAALNFSKAGLKFTSNAYIQRTENS